MGGGGGVGLGAAGEGRLECQPAAERQIAEPAERQRQAGDVAGVRGIAVAVLVPREVVGRDVWRELRPVQQVAQPVGHASRERVVREAGEFQPGEVAQRAGIAPLSLLSRRDSCVRELRSPSSAGIVPLN